MAWQLMRELDHSQEESIHGMRHCDLSGYEQSSHGWVVLTGYSAPGHMSRVTEERVLLGDLWGFAIVSKSPFLVRGFMFCLRLSVRTSITSLRF